ncbi:MAG: hypothetical protein ACRD3C_20305 [Vicinamibacterales bacterium]
MAEDRDDLGVNVGPDARLPWPLGPILGRFQQQNAFKSSHPPITIVRGSEAEGWLEQVSYSVPGHKAFYGWAKRRDDGRWDTFRMGYRWDQNWGDHNVGTGFNPNPEIVGGYFPDIIRKRGQKVPHIYLDNVTLGEDLAGFTPPPAEWWERYAPILARQAGAR